MGKIGEELGGDHAPKGKRKGNQLFKNTKKGIDREKKRRKGGKARLAKPLRRKDSDIKKGLANTILSSFRKH